MRMHRLEIEGFGPFRRPQVVDFDAFAEDGIFVISGRTGAGKSSILDAICFALYGSVPRYDAGEKRLRSDHCAPEDPTLVSLEFSAGGELWRVERSPEYERAKRNGSGTTTPGCSWLTVHIAGDASDAGFAAQAKTIRWVKSAMRCTCGVSSAGGALSSSVMSASCQASR